MALFQLSTKYSVLGTPPPLMSAARVTPPHHHPSSGFLRAEGRGRRVETPPLRGARRVGQHLPHRAHQEQVK